MSVLIKSSYQNCFQPFDKPSTIKISKLVQIKVRKKNTTKSIQITFYHFHKSTFSSFKGTSCVQIVHTYGEYAYWVMCVKEKSWKFVWKKNVEKRFGWFQKMVPNLNFSVNSNKVFVKYWAFFVSELFSSLIFCHFSVNSLVQSSFLLVWRKKNSLAVSKSL